MIIRIFFKDRLVQRFNPVDKIINFANLSNCRSPNRWTEMGRLAMGLSYDSLLLFVTLAHSLVFGGLRGFLNVELCAEVITTNIVRVLQLVRET